MRNLRKNVLTRKEWWILGKKGREHLILAIQSFANESWRSTIFVNCLGTLHSQELMRKMWAQYFVPRSYLVGLLAKSVFSVVMDPKWWVNNWLR